MAIKKGLRRLKKGERQQERYARLKENELMEVSRIKTKSEGVAVKCLITHEGRNKWVKGKRVGNTIFYDNEKYNCCILHSFKEVKK